VGTAVGAGGLVASGALVAAGADVAEGDWGAVGCPAHAARTSRLNKDKIKIIRFMVRSPQNILDLFYLNSKYYIHI
jgi:hypothetical protein